MSKIEKKIAILLVVLFVVTVTAGAVSAKKIDKSTGSPTTKAGKYTVSLTIKPTFGRSTFNFENFY